MATHTDPEHDENFFTRKRGKVKGKYIVVPVALFWVISLLIAVFTGLKYRPHLVPYTAALYGCAAFFVHAYVVGWRAGAILFRYTSLFFAILFYAVLCFLHADEAGARLLYSGSGLVARPPEPVLFVAVVLNVLGALILLIHGFFLGLGSRDPTPKERGISAQTASTAASMDPSEESGGTQPEPAPSSGDPTPSASAAHSPFPPDSGESIATP